jgi:hypothetical protein
MRKVMDLTESEIELAVRIRAHQLATESLYGTTLLEDELQDRIEEIREESEDLQTPWFAVEMIFEDAKLAFAINKLAIEELKDAFFPDANDLIIMLRDA